MAERAPDEETRQRLIGLAGLFEREGRVVAASKSSGH